MRKRFNSRAVVSARVAGEAPVALSHVYALLESGGLVLVVCCPEDPHHEHTHGGHVHEHGEPSSPPDGEEGLTLELWVESPEHVIFEARCAEEGALCTGFGYLGLSRTPRVLVPRGTEPPPQKGHHHENF